MGPHVEIVPPPIKVVVATTNTFEDVFSMFDKIYMMGIDDVRKKGAKYLVTQSEDSGL